MLRASVGLAGVLVSGKDPFAAPADPIQSVQSLIDRYYENSLNTHGANVGVVVGIVTADDLLVELTRQLSAIGDTIAEPADAEDSR